MDATKNSILLAPLLSSLFFSSSLSAVWGSFSWWTVKLLSWSFRRLPIHTGVTILYSCPLFSPCPPSPLPWCFHLEPLPLFSPSHGLLGSTDERHPPQCGETRDKGEEEGTSQRRTFTHTGEVMTSTMSYDRWGKATRENRKRWWNDRNKHD